MVFMLPAASADRNDVQNFASRSCKIYYEPSIPGQDGVGFGDAGNLLERVAS